MFVSPISSVYCSYFMQRLHDHVTLGENSKPEAITNFDHNDALSATSKHGSVALIPSSRMVNGAIYIAITMIHAAMKTGLQPKFVLPQDRLSARSAECGREWTRFSKRMRWDRAGFLPARNQFVKSKVEADQVCQMAATRWRRMPNRCLWNDFAEFTVQKMFRMWFRDWW